MTWDEFERSTAFRRPQDWRDRPDGPDDVDPFVAENRAMGGLIGRRDVFAAMTIAPPPGDCR